MDSVSVWLARAQVSRRAGRCDADAEQHLERAFGCSRRLAVYGTLAPGERHHDELAACPGTWAAGTVTGHRAERDHPVFTFAADGPPVPVQLLVSAALPGHWPKLDAFEGDGYCRIPVPVALADGTATVAWLYEARVPVAPAQPETTRPRPVE
ncbi:MAG: gamma-glutamylcyclotransferase [Planctomycetes bacterium]|nr:gamma-glutamylcyclotransferase [Planctomycetota bacterium]